MMQHNNTSVHTYMMYTLYSFAYRKYQGDSSTSKGQQSEYDKLKCYSYKF